MSFRRLSSCSLMFFSDPRPTPKKVKAIDKKISDLEKKLEKLRLEREQILASQALITRLPSEILSRVFELSTHENSEILPTISLISRHWRQVVLETPSLWSYIRLDQNWGVGHTQEFLRKIRTYMARSKDAKILVDLDFHWCESLADARDYLNELGPHLSRCFSFRASVPDWDWMALLKNYTSHMEASLEEVSLRINNVEDSDEQPAIAVFSGVFTRLKSITLEQTPLACIRAETPNLRNFHLIRDQRVHSISKIRLSVKEFLTNMVASETLEDVRLQSALFYLDGTESVFQGLPTQVVIPNLRNLSIAFMDSSNISLFLNSVALPRLHRLAVQMESVSEDNMHWLTQVSISCSQNFPNLKHLELRGFYIEGAALAPFVRALHNMPQLTALALCSPTTGVIGSKFFDLLAGGPLLTGRWILPNLEALCVQNCRDISGHELLRVVKARQGRIVPDAKDIVAIRIATYQSLDVDVVELLKQNVDTLQII